MLDFTSLVNVLLVARTVVDFLDTNVISSSNSIVDVSLAFGKSVVDITPSSIVGVIVELCFSSSSINGVDVIVELFISSINIVVVEGCFTPTVVSVDVVEVSFSLNFLVGVGVVGVGGGVGVVGSVVNFVGVVGDVVVDFVVVVIVEVSFTRNVVFIGVDDVVELCGNASVFIVVGDDD